jgi:two-component system LytT family response regulator
MVVDDEPLGRKKVAMMLAGVPDVEMVGEFAGGPETVEAVKGLQPDLLFLDVQMPGMDGFELLREIGPDHLPLVVFVTAYEQHAVEAFRVHALDYLLKPFDRERLLEALARARQQLDQTLREDVQAKLATFLEMPRPAQRLERILVKSAGRISFLKVEEVDWIEAQGDYVRLHVTGKKHLIRERISELEQQLSSDRFIRIHRSTIVNIDRIKEMQPLFYGEYAVVLHDGTRLTLSRSYRDKVFQRLTASG